MTVTIRLNRIQGFSLIEAMIALVLIASGVLASSSLFAIAASSDSLARSMGAATIAAEDKLEWLAALYSRNPSAEELTPGTHGPVRSRIINPSDGTVLNRFDLAWTVSFVPDPRPGKGKEAKLVRVEATPVHANGAKNSRSPFNKVFNVATIFSLRMK